MSEYVDVAIIENGKIIGSFKALNKTKEKIEKVDDKTAYENLLIKYAELEQQIEKMKCCQNCKNLLSLAYGEFSCDLYGKCKHYSKWEIKENG